MKKDILEVYIRKKVENIKRKLRIAHLDLDASEFLKRTAVTAIFFAITFSVIVFLMMDKFRTSVTILNNILVTLSVLIITFLLVFLFMLRTIDVQIMKRRKEMDQEVLFAGRYLLVKMQSGTPFFNSLIDASKVFGVAGRFFKEIIDEVNTGTPIEKALEEAAEYCPSRKFSMILAEMNNALKLGVDISRTLELILDDIAYEQLDEIKAFGKKINALSMFYMIFAVVMPSLGMTIFIIAAAFIGLTLKTIHLNIVIALLMFFQFMFLALFKTVRPAVNV